MLAFRPSASSSATYSNVTEVNGLSFDEVDQATRRGYDMNAFPEIADLHADGSTSRTQRLRPVVPFLFKVGQVIGNLQAEFAGGADDQGLGKPSSFLIS